jgi:hypothetical protein
LELIAHGAEVIEGEVARAAPVKLDEAKPLSPRQM